MLAKAALVAALLHLAAAAAAPSRPYQLQVNYQRAPALGVGKSLRFSWAVPAVPAPPKPPPPPPPQQQHHQQQQQTAPPAPHTQSSYRIVVTALDSVAPAAHPPHTTASGPHVVWDSGVVHSAASINVPLLPDAPAAGLLPGAAYSWTVACDGGAPSAPARFVTALWDGFDDAARWIWAADRNGSQHFAHFRHVLGSSSGGGGVGSSISRRSSSSSSNRSSSSSNNNSSNRTLTRALLFVTAWQEPTMLAAFKFYVGGRLVAIGPGRGEADVLGRNATLVHAPYVTVDATDAVLAAAGAGGGGAAAAAADGAGVVLAIEGMAPLFAAPCLLHACKDYNRAGGGVLAQLVLRYDDGGSRTVVTSGGGGGGGDGGGDWRAVARDAYYAPSAPGVGASPQWTAYAKLLEHMDARQETWPGWRTAADAALPPPAWPAAVPSAYQERGSLIAKMARPLVVYDVQPPTVVRNTTTTTADTPYVDYLVDFGREFQGGVVLTVHAGAADAAATAGTQVRIVAGELLLPGGATDSSTLDSRLAPSNTWGFAMNWTLRGGAQQLAQHECVIARFFRDPSLLCCCCCCALEEDLLTQQPPVLLATHSTQPLQVHDLPLPRIAHLRARRLLDQGGRRRLGPALELLRRRVGRQVRVRPRRLRLRLLQRHAERRARAGALDAGRRRAGHLHGLQLARAPPVRVRRPRGVGEPPGAAGRRDVGAALARLGAGGARASWGTARCCCCLLCSSVLASACLFPRVAHLQTLCAFLSLTHSLTHSHARRLAGCCRR